MKYKVFWYLIGQPYCINADYLDTGNKKRSKSWAVNQSIMLYGKKGKGVLSYNKSWRHYNFDTDTDEFTINVVAY